MELRRFLVRKELNGEDGMILGMRENGMILIMRLMKGMEDGMILGMRENGRILRMRGMNRIMECERILGMRENGRILSVPLMLFSAVK